MAYQHQGSCASAGDTLELLAFDDEFDPLAVDDSEIDQEWMDDENPYDTIDYPTMRNMPETVHHDPVYSAGYRQGSATEALQALIVRNPNRRLCCRNIIGFQARAAALERHFRERVDGGSATTGRYTLPMTLCRMLSAPERLRWRCPCPREHESAEGGGVSGDSRDRGSGVARDSRGVGLAREYLAGKSFRAVVLGSDEARYAEVYAAVW